MAGGRWARSGAVICLTVIVDFRFSRLQAAGRLGRLAAGRPGRWAYCKKLARCGGMGSNGRLRGLHSGSIVHIFWGGTAQKFARMRDSRSWNWRALNLGNRSESLYGAHCIVSSFSFQHWYIDTFWPAFGSRLVFFFIFIFFWHWIFDDVTPFEKHSKGGVILSRSSQSWENLKFDTMLASTLKVVRRSASSQSAYHIIYHRIM